MVMKCLLAEVTDTPSALLQQPREEDVGGRRDEVRREMPRIFLVSREAEMRDCTVWNNKVGGFTVKSIYS